MPTHPASSFVQRYLAGDLEDRFALPPGDTTQALTLPRRCDRDRLVSALGAHAKRLGAPRAVFTALEGLAHPDSRVVVTGQQAGLLLGPTYTLSKAATAITLARQLSREDKPVLSVFWVASQDHDSAEVDHAHLLDLGEHLHTLTLPLPTGVPAGRVTLEPRWPADILEVLRAFKGNSPHHEEVVALVAGAAARASSYSDFFAALLYALLGEHGLIVIDPLEPTIAPLFRPVLEAELRCPLVSSGHINQAGQALRERGLEPQLGRAEGASNLFIEERQAGQHQAGQHQAGLAKRTLLRFDGDYHTDTQRYPQAALLALLEHDPSRITPAAGLRPITQDYALPTAVTVVGPGELRYFAQLREVYAQHGVAMPLIWPRATVTVLEPPVGRILDKFGLDAAQFQASAETLTHELLLALHGHGEAFEASLAALGEDSRELLRHVRPIDPTLERTVVRAEAQLERVIHRLKTKTAAALATQESTTSRQIARLEAHLLPLGMPQERCLSPFGFFLKFGVAPVIDAFLALPPEGDHTLRL